MMKPKLIPAGLVLLLSLASVCAAAPSASAQAPVKKTVGQFLNMSDSDTTWCELTGVVNRIRNNDKGNLYIDDGTGVVLIYGVWDREGRGIIALDVRKGDTLTVRGHRSVYDKRVIEMKGARYVSHSEGPDHANVQRFDEIDVQPSFRGKGLSEFSKWVSRHLKYPSEASAAHIDGQVVYEFLVGYDGSVQEVRIVQGAHPALDAEVLRVVKKAPKWKPGKVDGHPVRVKMRSAVIFSGEF